MMRKIISLILSLSLLSLFLLPIAASAQSLFNDACNGPATQSAVCQDKNQSQTPGSNSFYGKDGILLKVAQIVIIVVGTVSVIVIIIGGFKYTMSSGDPGNIASAKNTIVFAIVGLIVALLAGAIIQFVISRV